MASKEMNSGSDCGSGCSNSGQKMKSGSDSGCEEQRSFFSLKGNMKKKSDSDCGSGCGNSGQKMKSGSDSGGGCEEQRTLFCHKGNMKKKNDSDSSSNGKSMIFFAKNGFFSSLSLSQPLSLVLMR
jgi:hypothetical protein